MTPAGPETDCPSSTAGLWARMAPRFSRLPARPPTGPGRRAMPDAAEPDRSHRQPFVCEPQRLVASSRWDVNGVRDDVRDWLLEQFDGRAPDGELRVLIPTKVEFRKTCSRLVGDHREYSETARRIENVQVGLFLV